MSVELIEWPDAELVISGALRAALAAANPTRYPFAAGVLVATAYPADGATAVKHVRVRRSGGTPVNKVEDAPRLDFQVWYETGAASDAENRMQLARLTRSLLFSLRGNVTAGARIGQVTEFVGPGRFGDPINATREIILFTEEIRLRSVAA